MEKGQVAGFAGQLDKVFALVDKGAASTGLCPLGMLGEVAGDVSKGIAGDKGAAGPRGRVGPLDHGEQYFGHLGHSVGLSSAMETDIYRRIHPL